MLTYLLQMTACSAILYGYYHFFLRNEKFHQYNRFYLLSAVAISLLLPLLKIPVSVEAADDSSPIYAFVSTEETFLVTARPIFNYNLLIYCCYLAVVVVLLIRLAFAIKKIISIKNESVSEQLDDIRFIRTAHADAPFSFLKWLFWNRQTSVQSPEGQHIFRHEMYHIRSRHSLDLLFIEAVLCIFWFNPFFYLYRKEIKTIQEFLADKHATEGSNSTEYAQLLLLQAIGKHKQQLINPFFHNQLKRRIAMLTSSKKPQYQWLRKLLVLPIATAVICLFGFTYKKEIKTIVDAATSEKAAEEAIPMLPPAPVAIASTTDHKTPTDTVPKKTSFNEVSAHYNSGSGRYRMLNTVTIVSYSDNDLPKKVLNQGEMKIDVDARFPGNWNNFLARNLDGQTPTEKGAPAGQYEVMVKFTVNEDGNVSDVESVTNEGYGMEEEVIRVIKKSPAWQPAINNKSGQNQHVKSYRIQPINFQVIRQKLTETQDKVVKDIGVVTPPQQAKENTQYTKEPEVFTKVQVEAKYPENWVSFLHKNLNGRVPLNNNAPSGTYTTIIQFIVDKEGQLSDIKPLTKHGYGIEEEAMRVIRTSGKWAPAIQNGREVKAYRKQPITFQVTRE